MKKITSEMLAEIIGGKLIQKGVEVEMRYLSVDSRTILEGAKTIFFALKSPRNDGHNYLKKAYDNHVRTFVISSTNIEVSEFPNATFILVRNTLDALQLIAINKRESYTNRVVGITGSNGKTIVKEWLNELLSSEMQVVRSPKSYNSQIGVALSVWMLNTSASIALIEAGISERGEMARLERIVRPEIGILTNIGEAHQSNFDSIDEKIDEKLQLFKHCKQLIYHSDDQNVDTKVRSFAQTHSVSLFNWSNTDRNASMFIETIQVVDEGVGIIAISEGKQYSVSIPFTDNASIDNACTCLASLIAMGYSSEFLLNKFSTLSPIAMRLEIKSGNNGCLVINDSYNSDIQSLLIAIDTMVQQASRGHLRKTLILSDIQQSSYSLESLYKEVNSMIELKGVDRLIGIGPEISEHQHLFTIEKHFYPTTFDFLLAHNIGFNNDVILIKGARQFHFDAISDFLQQKVHETVLEIDLSAMVHNLNYFRSKLNPKTMMMAMVKAFSYGNGTAEIARLLEFHGVDYLAVAIADEGVELRNAGISMPIIVMNPEEHSFNLMIEHRLEPNIYSLSVFMKFLKAAKMNATTSFPIHIKLDTGMKRLGFDSNEELLKLLELVNENSELYVRSVFTHLAVSDDCSKDDFTLAQFARFEEMVKLIESKTDHPIIRHILNSAGIERFAHYQYEMVRLGIGLYGISAVDQAALQNVSTLKTTISQIRTVEKSETVGYGRRWTSQKKSQIAILPIGYADGLNRHLGNEVGRVWINGNIVPIVGSICMDMCMVDVSEIEAKEGDRVIIFGKEHPVIEMAKALDTIPYEIFTSVSQRVKRVYFTE